MSQLPTKAQVSAAQLAAQAYHGYMVPAMFDPWAGVLLAHTNLQAGEAVLDVACGTGVVTRQAARQVGASGQVSALDLNPAMLEVARSVSPTEGAAVTWVQGSAQSLPFPDGSFDVALCQHGLPFFPDRVGALCEMRRVLKPGGRLMVTVWQSLERAPMFMALNAAALRLVGLPVYSAPFVLGEPGVLGRLLAEAGFGRVHVSEQTCEIRFATPENFVARNLQASAAAIPVLSAMGETERADLARRMQDDMGAMLSENVQGGMLVTRMSGWIGEAWR
ncbi:class I SAM-dependent methyltransferase [Deinococcus altitudinis]|uniref:class I SAM-dependent methyltransferase n=1 Tax=Deinococcus altitudinis TaxID=468914 RepID=UPI0038912AB4